MDSGFFCLQVIGAFHQVAVDKINLQHKFAGHLEISPDGQPVFGQRAILLAAQELGLKTKVVRQDARRMDKAALPAVGQNRDGRYFILGKYDPGSKNDNHVVKPRLLIQYENCPPEFISIDELPDIWTGEVIYFASKVNFTGTLAKFDFTWFIPALIKYRRILGEIMLISLVLQLIGLATPLFFQVVMDKVLVNHAMKTLHVVAIGLVAANIFEALLSGIRTWVFAHTSSKLDVELGARLFRHMLNLPIAYFQSRRVGDSVARVRELENIRSFLTGNAITVVLDILFSFVFLAVMFSYSVKLTLIVIASIPLYVFLSLVFTPVLRRRLNEKFNKSAENQSFLVETISNIDTVKAMAVEPRWVKNWDDQLAGYVTSGLSATNISTIANGGITLISKLVTAAIMWIGASLVIDNQLTVGALVAFNMLSGQVSQPILRLAQLWNDFQQVGISMSRLGDILNTHPEVVDQKSRLPRLNGAIEFDQVTFRYRPDASEVLRKVSLTITPGEVIGIVGRSGSGKSTLTKLVQRLYIPASGRVLLDGHDLAVINTTSLRHQIGVVQQENNLFNRSIRANIALTNPTLPIEAVIEAAKLAGAHEFICELPEGYDTMVGEHGTGLSGGQRQRIAIARALISNPRILIFDEATSALDYESEKIIQDNMRRICEGRTVLIIAHRLSAVREANRIVVMERGEIAEVGHHDELVQHVGGIYAHLYTLQQGPVREACV
ncbi:type I secretion system permease/ATPase [Buttiauxella massiliensis]|uniref:type I secretion system permease/ATPase n=1 Tax=Buttiauxella massiliensis TaxID=2831590 RepID=UPI00125FD99F|nr:type I secretion system permease/ATPase [Buttiauxella massiliensis]